MHNPFLNLNELTDKQINDKILKLSGQLSTAKIYEMNPMTIQSIEANLNILHEELYIRRELKIAAKDTSGSCVFDIELYLEKNKEESAANESTRKPNYKPGW